MFILGLQGGEDKLNHLIGFATDFMLTLVELIQVKKTTEMSRSIKKMIRYRH